MRFNAITFIFNYFYVIIIFVIILSVVLYFFGDKLTLDNKKTKNKQVKQKYTYFFRQDIILNNINMIFFTIILFICFWFWQ